jgi:hypothetical protein
VVNADKVMIHVNRFVHPCLVLPGKIPESEDLLICDRKNLSIIETQVAKLQDLIVARLIGRVGPDG